MSEQMICQHNDHVNSGRVPPLSDFVFPTPFVYNDCCDGLEAYTVVEQQIMRGLSAIKEKPHWWRKASDDAICEKWHAELTDAFVNYLAEPRAWRYQGIDKEVEDLEANGTVAVGKHWADVVIKEIKESAQLVIEEESGEVSARVFAPGPVDGTWVSDDAVGPELKARLAELIRPLEFPTDRFNGQPVSRDYHPGSNEQVVDLVHPSLYPLVYGKSLVAPVAEGPETIYSWKKTIGTGAEAACQFKKVDPPRYVWDKVPEFHSNKFQWLPSEIDVRTDGTNKTRRKARFCSYINNLHPEEHTELYRVLEQIFATAFVPLFNKVLSELAICDKKKRRQEVCMGEESLYGECPLKPSQRGDDKEAYYDAMDAWKDARVPTVKTQVSAIENKTPASETSEVVPPPTIDLAGGQGKSTRLQVIVKLAVIELTPEKPAYGGGAWHVEGMINESIVASGIYYLSSENVQLASSNGKKDEAQPTRLSFRTSVREPNYEQCDYDGVEAVYNLFNEKPLIQPLGSVATPEGRCMAWPNTLQHQVQPFELTDATKPGHRKILVFFLVDPTKRIVSTGDVPPQQEGWVLKELLARKRAREGDDEESNAEREAGVSRTVLGNRDVLGEVLKFSWHFPHSDALAVREELMLERKVFVNDTMKEAYEREFSLCEH